MLFMSDTTGGKFRKKRSNFAMVSNEIIRDENMSLKAKGLYALIQSYITIDDFTLYKSFLQSHCKEGKKAFESAWKELKDSGYLVQYRMKNAKNQFYYEYELLDVLKPPDTLKRDSGKNPIPQNGCIGKGVQSETDIIQTGGDTSKTDLSNNLSHNMLSYHILSVDDVREQIEYQIYPIREKEQVDEIVLLMAEVYQMPEHKKIRINRMDLPVRKVQERFAQLTSSHIEYVLETLSRNVGHVGNIRAYLLTTLYNSPTTLNSFYQNWVNHDMYGS